MKILILEDEYQTAELLRSYLSKCGDYDVTICYDGETALDICRKEHYPLLLVDIGLSGMDGFEFCRKIRELPRGRYSVILVITGIVAPKNLNNVLDAGADDYIRKPVDIELFKVRLRINEQVARDRAESEKHIIALKQCFDDLETKIEAKAKKCAETKNLLESLFQGSADPIALYDLEDNIIDINPAFVEIFGYEREELIGKKFPGHFGVDEGKFIQWLNQCNVGKGVSGYETIRKRKDGTPLHMSITVSPIKDAEGILKAVSFWYQDITERKKAEKKLKKYKQIVSTTPDGISLVDKNYRYQIVNDAYEKFSSLKREHLIGSTVSEYLGEEVFEQKIKTRFDKCLNGEVINYKDWFEYPRLGERFVSVTYYPYRNVKGEIEGVVANTRDITDQKRAEQALKDREEELSAIIQIAPFVMFVVDKERRILTMNHAGLRFAESTEKEIIGRRGGEALRCLYALDDPRGCGFGVHCKDCKIRQIVMNTFETGKRHTAVEVEFVTTRHGYEHAEKLYLLASTALFVVSGSPKVLVSLQDITDQKRTEQALRKSERRYRTMAEHFPNGAIFLFDEELRYKLVAGKALKLVKLDPEDCVNKTMYDIFPKEVTDIADQTEGEIFEGDSVYYEVEFKDRIFACWGVPIEDETGKITEGLVYAVDITDLKEKERKLTHALEERTALLMEVQHRTRNNMQIINSMLALKSQHVTDEEVLQVFQEMRSRIFSMALVHRLLHKSKSLSRIDLKEYISNLIIALQDSYWQMATKVSFELDLESISVLIDCALPCGLILNELITNSFKYAFPGDRKGVIRITLRQDEDKVIHLAISDNGVGIPESVVLNNTESLGLQLLSILSEQLGAEFEFDSTDGVSCRLHFKDNLYFERV